MTEPEREIEWRRRYGESLDRQLELTKERDALRQEIERLRGVMEQLNRVICSGFNSLDWLVLTESYKAFAAALAPQDTPNG